MAVNTEKPQSLAAKKQERVVKTPKQKVEVSKAPVKEKDEKKVDAAKAPEVKPETKQEEKPTQPIVKKEVKKKDEVSVRGVNLPISTKYSMAICKFIKNKTINNAIADLEQVVVLKKAVPMKGEIPHRKGKIMSGRFPKKAGEHFIKLLKSLRANAINHEIEAPVITEAIANIGARPYGRFGSVRRKRTHVKIVARTEKEMVKKSKKKVGGKRK